MLFLGLGGQFADYRYHVHPHLLPFLHFTRFSIPIYPRIRNLGSSFVLIYHNDRNNLHAPLRPKTRSPAPIRPSAGYTHNAAAIKGSGPRPDHRRHPGLHGPVDRRQSEWRQTPPLSPGEWIFRPRFHVKIVVSRDTLFQLIPEMVLLLAGSCTGLYYRSMTEGAHRRTFVGTRTCIESRVKLECEKEQQEQLLLSVIPAYIAAEVSQ